MIAPQTRLILAATVVIIPSLGLWALVSDPLIQTLTLTVLVMFFMLLIIDAMKVWYVPRQIKVQPITELQRLVLEHEGVLTFLCTWEEEKNKKSSFKMGLKVPPSLVISHAGQIVEFEESVKQVEVRLSCQPFERGSFLIDNCQVEVCSSMGFWAKRKKTPLKCEIRVYPNLDEEKAVISALFNKRMFSGLHVQRQVGQGREFEKLRDYIPGDSYDDISWKATAKRRTPVTKEYQIETEQQIYVVLDCSRLSSRKSSLRRGASKLKQTGPQRNYLEKGVETAMLLNIAAENQKDAFGIVTFSDQVENFIRAGHGRATFMACRDALFQVQPKLVAPDYQEVCTQLRTKVRKRSLLVFITSLDDVGVMDQLLAGVQILRSKHLVLICYLQPKKIEPIFAGHAVSSGSEVYERLAGHMAWKQMHEVENKLLSQGVLSVGVEFQSMASEIVSQYLNVKRRQIL
ncbi:MAG: DUF58 domain-containing protein [Verrucomicrobiota bacterium]